jgi:UDP-N-acetyl-D-glucosamine dehydrogenase
MSIVGLDIDRAKVEKLNRGESFIHHIPSSSVAEEVTSGRFRASCDFAEVGQCRAVVICVPTPLNKNREPDISYIIATGKAIAPHLRKGVLVVLESTTYPGTTDEDLREVLEEGSGLKAGTDFHLAFSPEREDPGNPDSVVAKIPKVVGGLTLSASSVRRSFTARRSIRWCLFRAAARPRPPNCWRTFSEV